jgi:hypothetical protein
MHRSQRPSVSHIASGTSSESDRDKDGAANAGDGGKHARTFGVEPLVGKLNEPRSSFRVIDFHKNH